MWQPYVAYGIGTAYIRGDDWSETAFIASWYFGLVTRYPRKFFAYISFEGGYRWVSPVSYIPVNIYAKFRLGENVNLLTTVSMDYEITGLIDIRFSLGPEFYF